MNRMSYRDLLRTALDEGTPLAMALVVLRGSGASPLEAAVAVQDVCGRSWVEASAVVAESRAWCGPRPALQPAARSRAESFGAIGQHGRSGHGASSVLPHLWRPAPRTTDQPTR